MAATFNQYNGDGTSRNFALSFPYLDRSHVRVTLSEEPSNAFTWLNDSMVRMNAAPPSGVLVDIRRVTPTGVLPVDFADGSVLAEADLDRLATFSAYLAEEARDAALTALQLTPSGVYDFRGRRATHLAPGVAPDDGVNKGQMEAAVMGALSGLLPDGISVKSFGAKGDGTTDDTAAFNAALRVALRVNVPEGAYVLGGTVGITRNGQRLLGAGVGATVLLHTSATAPGISVAPYLTHWELGGFMSLRVGVPSNTAHGLFAPESASRAHVHDLMIQGSWHGFVGGTTDYSRLQNVHCFRNYGDGFRFTNSAGYGAVQWYLSHCLAESNNGNGFLFKAAAGPTAVALGTILDCATYANGICGIAFIGLPSCPIHGIRLDSGFYGQDGSHGVLLDTYGMLHSMQGVFTELAGRGFTGVADSTPASGVGSGFYVTANNRDVTLSDCRADGHSNSGLITRATTTQVTGGAYTDNGAALVADNRSGILCLGGRLRVTGAIAGGFGASYQQRGIAAVDGRDLILMGNDLSGNTVAPWACTSNPNAVTAIGNFPALPQ